MYVFQSTCVLCMLTSKAKCQGKQSLQPDSWLAEHICTPDLSGLCGRVLNVVHRAELPSPHHQATPQPIMHV